ncbi:hypothetical protein V1517DRAFT_334837 [Lipomyces orientalis]|uniref:Uncharacterized protein n=1 Tax=Lipomyces orientalis TaxID=1233043 RepID=A0ACC3TCI8_9ASCO
MQREQRGFLQNHMYPGYLMQPQLPLHSPGQIPYTKPNNFTSSSARQQQRNSSPINADEDDADILALFFNWKISNTGNSDRRTKWQHARDVVFRNDWTVFRPCIGEPYRPGYQMVLPVASELSSTFLKRTIGSLKLMRRLHQAIAAVVEAGFSRIPLGFRPRPKYISPSF